MGMNNRQAVGLSLPPILTKGLKLPAAIMYFGFFAVGVLSGTFLNARQEGRGQRQEQTSEIIIGPNRLAGKLARDE